jgi:hypothetical protein
MRSAARFGAQILTTLAAVAVLATVSFAQEDSTKKDRTAAWPSDRVNAQPVKVQHYRPNDIRGIGMFEAPKIDDVGYDGFVLQWNGSFTQQMQGLEHENNATVRLGTGADSATNLNQLIDIGTGANNAMANLSFDAQIARGVRVELTSYLSTRHHNETWVKDGYLLLDGSPWDIEMLDNIMKVVTVKLGHYEINYGDMHYRRSDAGQTFFNPLVGNLIMDAFTTEVGGEIMVRKNGLIGMFGLTGGEVRGQVLKPGDRKASILGKLGFDRHLREDLRVRLTGSLYTTQSSVNNTLYSGSRAGSRYYYVLENVKATESAQAWSGDVQPGYRDNVTAWVVNPYVEFKGIELFGNIEQSSGRNQGELTDRDWSQYAGDAVYRFAKDQFYVAGRYCVAEGRFQGFTSDVSVDRTEVGGGWFLTPNALLKLEYVVQNYNDFPANDIRHDGQFSGFMMEAAISF